MLFINFSRNFYSFGSIYPIRRKTSHYLSKATGITMRLAATAFAAAALAATATAIAQPLVTPAWLAARRTDPHVVVLDLRPAAQYAAGHVPGAVTADYEHSGWRMKLPGGAGGALPPVPRIAATIGRLGVGNADEAELVSNDFAAAARIYRTFKVFGHRAVAILHGGWKGWEQAHQPVQTAPADRIRLRPLFGLG